nr:OmpH family outer membrane protein [Aquimarina sp. U1-2]
MGYLIFQQKQTKRIAVVNAQVVLEKYDGFKEAQDLYETETKEMNEIFEKQKKLYESKSNELKIISERLSNNERKVKEGELEILKAKIVQLGKSIEEKAKTKEEDLLQGVYNKVNDFVERYAKANDLDLIEGTTASGNIMYASDAINITNDIINGLNKEYVEGVKE